MAQVYKIHLEDLSLSLGTNDLLTAVEMVKFDLRMP